jgi:hypothetical protein
MLNGYYNYVVGKITSMGEKKMKCLTCGKECNHKYFCCIEHELEYCDKQNAEQEEELKEPVKA